MEKQCVGTNHKDTLHTTSVLLSEGTTREVGCRQWIHTSAGGKGEVSPLGLGTGEWKGCVPRVSWPWLLPLILSH